jgi:DNA-binding transcriptional ArsR family regulator
MLVYMLNHKEPIGVRELQRDLKLSSPGLASYHLEKLVRLGLVAKNDRGDYFAVHEMKSDLIGATVRIRRLRLPRYLFYSVFYTTLFFIYLLFFYDSPLERLFLLTLGATGSVFLWYETYRLRG